MPHTVMVRRLNLHGAYPKQRTAEGRKVTGKRATPARGEKNVEAIELVRQIAAMNSDRECIVCGLDEDACKCGIYKNIFDMESDDAVETVNSLIRQARQIRAAETETWYEPEFSSKTAEEDDWVASNQKFDSVATAKKTMKRFLRGLFKGYSHRIVKVTVTREVVE
jgi:hypothetical protein